MWPVTGKPVTWAQVPLTVPSHCSHWPVHAVLQQTPSAQCPLSQSTSTPQLAPSGLRHLNELSPVTISHLSLPVHAAPVAPHTQPLTEHRLAYCALHTLPHVVQLFVSAARSRQS